MGRDPLEVDGNATGGEGMDCRPDADKGGREESRWGRVEIRQDGERVGEEAGSGEGTGMLVADYPVQRGLESHSLSVKARAN